MTQLLNVLFLTGLCCLMIAGIYYVIVGGFFSVMGKGFKLVRDLFPRQSSRLEGFQEAPDHLQNESSSHKHRLLSQLIISITIIGTIDILLSFLLIK
ncbi:DUF3899 domain-containing protein [Mechercharimyces sp. CAU 1602]|nr:DUF3899 domain-containing protein [Mechercharimyces sp. CAU 1602]